MLTFKVIIIAVAVLAVALSGLLAYSNWKYSGKLAQARVLTQTYIDEAKAANAASARAEIAAAASQAAAAEQTAAAKAHADKARVLQSQLAAIRSAIPAGGTSIDTLAAHIASAREARDVAVSAAESWRLAYETQLEAHAKLQSTIDTLVPALAAERAASAKLQAGSQKLVDATGESFWKRLIPKFSINATVGIDPTKPEEGIKKIVGIGGSWAL